MRSSRAAPSFVLALGVVLGCGGTTRIGSTGDGDRPDSGGNSGDGGGRSTGGSTGGRGDMPSTGGRSFGGRSSGGFVASGGRLATGGVPIADASIGGAGGSERVFDAGSDPFRNRVPPGFVCDRLSTIQCAGDSFCCPSARSFEACKQTMQGACQQFMDTWSANPAVGYDMDRAAAAFAEFEKRASICDTSIQAWALSNEGFRGVARGTVPSGEQCLSIDAGGVSVESVALLGSCAAPESYACMYSPTDNTKWVCAARGTTGDRCFTPMNCLEGLYCDFGRPMSVCLERKPNGAPCNNLLECDSMSCTNGICGPATVEAVYCLPY